MKTMKKYQDGGGKITRSDIKNAQRAAKLKRIEAGTEPSTYDKVSNIAGKVADTAASAASTSKAIKDVRSGINSNPGGMKKGGSVKRKMQTGGMHMMPDGSMMKNSMMKKGGAVKKLPKAQYGGKPTLLKPANNSLANKPTKSLAYKNGVKPTNANPKTGQQKAKYGMTMKKMQDGGPAGTSPESQIKRSMIKNSFNNARAITKGRSGKPNGKI